MTMFLLTNIFRLWRLLSEVQTIHYFDFSSPWQQFGQFIKQSKLYTLYLPATGRDFVKNKKKRKAGKHNESSWINDENPLNSFGLAWKIPNKIIFETNLFQRWPDMDKLMIITSASEFCGLMFEVEFWYII